MGRIDQNYTSLEDILLSRNCVSEKDIHQAKHLQSEIGGLLGQTLVRIGALSEELLLQTQSEHLGIETLDAGDLPTDTSLYQQAAQFVGVKPGWFLSRKAAMWIYPESDVVHVIAQNILDGELRELMERLQFKKGLTTKYYLVTNYTLETAISRMVNLDDNQDQGLDDDTVKLKELAEQAPVIDFVNRVFSMALKENASDIHIEPYEHNFVVRYRIDGILHTRQTEPKSRFDAVTSRIKLLSGMDIAERRLPQDGRQTIRFAGQEIDLRVSSLPSSWGESLVMRLLKKETSLPDLEALGLQNRAKNSLEGMLSHPNGVILITGPTGSGKSTTIYKSLQGLNDGVRKIITIEDPVEYEMDGIIQIQTKAHIGYTFAKGLRAILRQDPDIIMVGEIRDGETATIAAQSALTGHLVLSTLHTNSALAAIARLIDIGLEPYMISSAVRGLVAQRLLRKLCPECKVPVKSKEGDEYILNMFKAGMNIDEYMGKEANWYAPKGCSLCSHTGYLGRVAIFEVAKIDGPLTEAILNNASLTQLVNVARQQGFITLFEDGIMKARQGVTTISEVTRVCGEEFSNVESS